MHIKNERPPCNPTPQLIIRICDASSLVVKKVFCGLLGLALLVSYACATDYPAPAEADFTIHDFKFADGESMPELRIHYRTLGAAQKNAEGKTTNAVLIMHGTTGSGAQFIRPEFAGELFGPGQPLDAAKFFIVLPDGIGHGKSSKRKISALRLPRHDRGAVSFVE